MRLAIAHVDVTGGVIDKNAVRPAHGAFERIAVRAVAFFARSRDQSQGRRLRGKVDRADGVALGVGQVNVALRTDADALGTGERRFFGRAAVAGESLFAGAGDVADFAGFGHVDAHDLVPLTQGQPQVALGVEIDGTRAVERGFRLVEAVAVVGAVAFAVAANGRDGFGLEVDSANPMVADVADKEAVAEVRVELNAVRPAKLRLEGGSVAVAIETGLAGSGHGVDDPGFHFHHADEVIFHLHEEQIAVFVEAQFVGLEKFRIGCLAAVAPVAADSGRAGDGRDFAGFAVDLANGVVAGVAKIDVTVRADDDAEGIVDLRLVCGAAVAGITGLAGAGEGDDFQVLGKNQRRGENERKDGFQGG